MRNKVVPIIIIMLTALILTGCWDTNNIVEQRIISAIGMDLGENNSIAGTIRALRLESKGGGQFKVQDELVQSTGKSLLEVGNNLDNMLAGESIGDKTHIIILDEKLAKQGIYELLEFFYRNPRSYVGSKILISQGQAADILSLDKLEKSPISFEVLQMIQGAERTTVIPAQTLYSLWSKMFDPGQDAVLPFIRIKNSKNLFLDSIALFHSNRFTGEILSNEDSTLLLLLMDELSHMARINAEIDPIRPSGNTTDQDKEIISFNARKMKRKLHITVDEASDAITCSIKVDLYVEIVNYPHQSGVDKEKVKLNNALSLALNERAEVIAKKLLNANSDVFGVKSHLTAFHPSLTKRLNWEEHYRKVRLIPEFSVHIIGSGVLK